MADDKIMAIQMSQVEEMLRKGDASEIQAFYKNDRHRPLYHFVPIGWMNDINGLLFWKGRYHIFYQAYPYGAYWCNISWGHASSTDFINWEIHPIILEPAPGGYDQKGVFSGHIFLDDDGIPTIVYFGNPGGVCLAVPEDLDDPLLLNWNRHANNPILPKPSLESDEYTNYDVFDPSNPWKEDGFWYMTTGNKYPNDPMKRKGDVTYLFKSRDLMKWDFIGPLYQSHNRWTSPQEDCAVPCFFTLMDKRVLMFSSHVFGTQYYTGSYGNHEFVPERHDRISFPGAMIAGSIVSTVPDGRTIHLGWALDWRDKQSQRASGWSGIMTLPWELTLREDGLLSAQPASEIRELRHNERSRHNILLHAGQEIGLPGFEGDVMELDLTIDPGNCSLCGIKVRSSGDGLEETGIYYDAVNQLIRIDLRRSSLDATIEYKKYFYNAEILPVTASIVSFTEAPFKRMDHEKLNFNIFLDKSVIELFVNGRRFLIQRVYPTLERSKGVALYAKDGDVLVESITAWDMNPSEK
ncbi:glycoside hydrolase family 32 protein [Paenibacillus cymbidii]|uniref:glycoside hydrolase family 32 protein n=1 Tax=Paenibacillus cymbidii TaxID=1639034 RepID=UPI0010801161|nr:glycoside hydrolase family 32 protein [Paenibacillus cymbidii]